MIESSKTETSSEASAPQGTPLLGSAAGRGFSRRKVVIGAAWAVPVVTLAVATPAMAVSGIIPPNALEGVVQLRKECFFNTSLTITGAGSYPNRGLWVVITDPNATIEAAEIIFFFTKSNLTFSNSSGTGWSNLARYPAGDGEIGGYFAYRTQYTGAQANRWTYVSNTANPRWEAKNKPRFTTTFDQGCVKISAYARRTVTVNGTTVTFRRGPVSL